MIATTTTTPEDFDAERIVISPFIDRSMPSQTCLMYNCLNLAICLPNLSVSALIVLALRVQH